MKKYLKTIGFISLLTVTFAVSGCGKEENIPMTADEKITTQVSSESVVTEETTVTEETVLETKATLETIQTKSTIKPKIEKKSEETEEKAEETEQAPSENKPVQEKPSEDVQPTYFDCEYGRVLVINKSYAVGPSYYPANMITVPGGEQLVEDVYAAFSKMQQDAAAEGLNLYIPSGYRTYETQNRLYNNYCSRDGKAAADTYSARPGHSEHHSGLCFDLNSIDDSFADTAEGKWVAANCHKYGFVIRYPKSKEAQTGYKYEPWHLRYLGIDFATNLYENDLCLEEYLGITSSYAD